MSLQLRGVLAATLLFMLPAVGASQAQTVEDPLHGECSGCSESTIGGNAVTPIDGVSNFSFASSPKNSGDLVLKLLIPDTVSLSSVDSFLADDSITGTSGIIPIGVAALVSTTPWTSGDLEKDYLGVTSFANGVPPNPLAAWIGATDTVDPGANGYYVALVDVGNYSLLTPGNAQPDTFSISGPDSYFQGGLIVADLFTGPNHTLDVTTAQSGALFDSKPNTSVDPVPEPITALMFGPAILGCFLLRRRQQKAKSPEATA